VVDLETELNEDVKFGTPLWTWCKFGIISVKEYNILEKMSSEGKLDEDNFPKTYEFFTEYIRLMNA